MAENYIFIGQTFLKVKPIDRLREMQMCAEDMYDLAEDYTRLAKKGTLSDNEKKELDSIVDEFGAKCSFLKGDRYDETGMDHFWTLTVSEAGFCLITIPNHTKDIIVMESFKSAEDISKYYRSLDDIIANAKFIGKKLHSAYNSPAYILYDIGDQLLGISLDDDGNPIGPVLAKKNGAKRIYYEDETMPELDDPEVLHNYVRKMKKRGN